MEDQRNILITGVTRGLGRALAESFAELGHSVAGCGRSAADLDTLAAAWAHSHAPLQGGGHHLRAADVRDAAAMKGWASDLEGAGWVPDLLVNNAGVINRQAPLWELSAEEFDLVIDVNVKGVVNVIRAFLPAMIDRGRGVVVNISSGWGHDTAADVAPYCASKFAIEGLTGALAHELPPGLAAVPLSPGIIHTEMLEIAFGDGAAAHWKPRQWIAEAVPFLLQLGEKDNGRSQRIPGS